MCARERVVNGLLELAESYDILDEAYIPNAIWALGYPEFCEPLLRLITSDHERYSDFISSYCRCAQRSETGQLLMFLESGDWSKVFNALCAVERLHLVEALPILEQLSPIDPINRNQVKQTIAYLTKNS